MIDAFLLRTLDDRALEQLYLGVKRAIGAKREQLQDARSADHRAYCNEVLCQLFDARDTLLRVMGDRVAAAAAA